MNEGLETSNQEAFHKYADNLTKEFISKRSDFVNFTSDLVSLVAKLLEYSSIELAAFEDRTKEVDSFKEKILRPEKRNKYATCDDVTDLSGLRLICYLHEEAEAVSKLIHDHFDVDIIQSKYRHQFLSDDKLGYRADHLIVSLSSERSKLPELAKYKNFKAEIQVKTVLEHAWAAVDWKIRYKSDLGIPGPIARRLYRISAFLEGADEEFSRIKQETDRLRITYQTQIDSGNLAIAVDRESISLLLEKSPAVAAIIEGAEESGIKLSPHTPNNGELIEGLIKVVSALKIADIGTLEARLESNAVFSKNIFEQILLHTQHKKKEDGTPDASATIESIMRMFLMSSSNEEELNNIFSSNGYSEKSQEIFKSVVTILQKEKYRHQESYNNHRV